MQRSDDAGNFPAGEFIPSLSGPALYGMSPGMVVLDVLSCVLVMFGSLPLAIRLSNVLLRETGREETIDEAAGLRRMLTTGLVWLLVKMTLSLSLLALGMFRSNVLLLTSGCLLLVGMTNIRSLALASAGRSLFGMRNAGPLVAIGCLGVLLAVLLVVKPLTDYDTLAYHLPTIHGWMRNGFHGPPPGFENDQIGTYPYGWEALCAPPWFFLSSTSLLLFPNLVSWTLLGVAIMLLAAQGGASKESAQCAALLLLSFPLTIAQVDTLHVDLTCAMLFASGCYFVQRWALFDGLADALLAFICASLFLAVKMSGIPYVALLGLSAVVLRWRACGSRIRNAVSISFAGCAVALSAAAIFCASWFYYRNWIRLGNPIGYLPVSLLGWKLFPGNEGFGAFISQTTLAHLFRYRSPEDYVVIGKVVAFYLGIPFAILGVFLCRSIVRQMASSGMDFWWRNLLWGIGLVLYTVTPYSGDNGSHAGRITTWIGDPLRYGLPAWSLFAASSALGLPPLAVKYPRWRSLLIVLPPCLVLFRQLATGYLGSRGIKLDTPAGAFLLLGGEAAALVVSALGVSLFHRRQHSSS